MIKTTQGEPANTSPVVAFDADAPLPEGKAKQDLVRSMFDSIAPRYDLVNFLMTFGLDASWRRRTIEMLRVSPAAVVLDIGCGTGDLARRLRRGGHSAVGIDFSERMLALARAVGTPLLQADATRLPVRSGAADAVVSGFALRNFADLTGVMNEIGRVLHPGGRLALLEVGEPRHRIVRFGHGIWFTHVVPRLGALLSDGAAYRYLPRSVAYLPSFSNFAGILADAGFTDVRQHLLSGGIVQCVTATRTSPSTGS